MEKDDGSGVRGVVTPTAPTAEPRVSVSMFLICLAVLIFVQCLNAAARRGDTLLIVSPFHTTCRFCSSRVVIRFFPLFAIHFPFFHCYSHFVLK